MECTLNHVLLLIKNNTSQIVYHVVNIGVQDVFKRNVNNVIFYTDAFDLVIVR